MKSKFKSLLAFLLTCLALLLVISIFVWLFLKYSIIRPYCYCFAASLKTDTNYTKVEPCKGKLMKISISNVGNTRDEYHISYSGPEWVEIKPKKIGLNPNETDHISVYISPYYGVKGGDYYLTIFANSKCVSESVGLKIKVL